MFTSDALSRQEMEAQEQIHDIKTPHFLQYLNTVHIYHDYEHLAYTHTQE